MIDALLIEHFSHLIVFLIVLIPIALIVSILVKEREELTMSLIWFVVGLLPLAVYHLLEFLAFFNLFWFPLEGTPSHLVLDHIVVIIAFLSVGFFVYLLD